MSKASQKKQDLQVIYNYVIDDVIAKVKPEFLGNGVDESTADELRQLWHQKIVENGLLIEPEPAPADEGQGSVPKAEEQEDGEEDDMAPPSPNGRGVKREADGQLGPGPSKFAALLGGDDEEDEGEEEGDIPQQDGPADYGGQGDPEEEERYGAQDYDDDEEEQEQEDAAAGDEPGEEGEEGMGGEGDAGEEEEEEEDEEEEEEEEPFTNFCCGFYDKVNRVKGRWKVALRDGVFTINNKDYCFKKANADLNFQ